MINQDDGVAKRQPMTNLAAAASLIVSPPFSHLDTSWLHNNQLTSLEVGLFDQNTALIDL